MYAHSCESIFFVFNIATSFISVSCFFTPHVENCRVGSTAYVPSPPPPMPLTKGGRVSAYRHRLGRVPCSRVRTCTFQRFTVLRLVSHDRYLTTSREVIARRCRISTTRTIFIFDVRFPTAAHWAFPTNVIHRVRCVAF